MPPFDATTSTQRNLKDPAEILELFFKDSLTCFVLLDRDFNFIRVNQAYADVCAREVSEFPGRNHFEMYPSPLEETFERVREEKRPWEVFSRPFVFPDHPDWGVTYWDLKLEPITGNDGEIRMFVFSLRDVTKHAVAEQEVRKLKEELEKKMNLFTRIASDWYWELDKNLNFTSIGPGYTEITGIPAEDYIGKHRPNMRPEGVSPEKWDQHTQDMYNHLTIDGFEFPRPSEKSKSTWLSISGEPFFDENGAFKGYRGTGRDITIRKLAEAALRESEHRLANAQKIAHLGSWYWDLTDDSEEWSVEQYRIFGYEPGEVVPTYDLFKQAVHPDDREGVLQAVAETLSTDIAYNTSFRVVRPSGEVRHVIAQGTVERDQKGNPSSMTGTVLDNTERREIEAQLAQASKLATLGEMSTEMAHELNQPMNVIRLAVANIERKIAKGTLENNWLSKKLKRISDQVERGASIIDHMRIFVRNEEGKPGRADLRACIDSAVDLTGEQIRLAGINLKVDIPDNEVLVLGHPIKIEQALINLLNNARQAIIESKQGHADASHQVCLRLSVPNELAEIDIEDTGGGISKDAIDRIFDPFYTTKKKGDGTGLGLSITYGIISDMGGTISVQNDRRGAVFTVSLPTVDRA